MRRSRHIAADPVRGSDETIGAVVDLVVAALPAINGDEVRGAFAKISGLLRYLVTTEHTALEPLTLVAGRLVCDVTTVHGEDALELEERSVPQGAGSARDWRCFVPVPEGSPFTPRDLAQASPHFRPGPAPDSFEEPEDSDENSAVIDADALRRATGR